MGMPTMNTLDYVAQLKSAGFSEEQAEAIARSPDYNARQWMEEKFATKDDLKHEFGQLRAELKQEIGEVRSDVKSLRSDMEKGHSSLKHEMGELRSDMQLELQKQMFRYAMGIVGVLGGLMAVFRFIH